MRNLFTLLFAFMACTAFAQISGRLVDGSTGEPLIGAAVAVDGTQNGTITDLDGNFALQASPSADLKLFITYIGYEDMLFLTEGRTTLGRVFMRPAALSLNEVVVSGTMDIAEDRKTPVAVSTITANEIQLKAPGNVEFPDIMKNTPSIYVAGQAGGFGDSEVFTRGFDQINTAFLLNGQPINGMEDGRMYWSNWSGLTDIASAVQIQRGLGSSKLAISSVGGTTNIIMKSTDKKKGGWAGTTVGNNNYNKTTFAYNTGMIKGKWGVSALLSHWSGDGWAYGTRGQGQNYFIAAGYKPSEKHDFQFLITGAPQWHDQNFNKRISQSEINGEIDPRYNNNWGTYDGRYFTERRNYYHKPVANLNWNFNINEKSNLSTVLYASWGRGGGTGNLGSRQRTSTGLVDFDGMAAANDTLASSSYIRRASVNNHNWVGTVVNYERKLTNNIDFSVGTDLRTYYGSHFRQVVDLVGGQGWNARTHARFGDRLVTNTFQADPWSALFDYAGAEDQINYSNDERISYGGVFAQLEYATDALSTYLQGAVSSQSHVRFEKYNLIEAEEESDKVVNPGYNVKGGANYNFDDNNGAYVNVGYYSRQPFHDNIFLNFSNTINPVTQNEDIFGLELGYKYRGSNFDANVNLYRTAWDNRTTTETIDQGQVVTLASGEMRVFDLGGFINLTNVNQLHQGVEVDFSYNVSQLLRLRGFGSIGQWEYAGNADRVIFDDNRNVIETTTGFEIDGNQIGGAAQTSFGLGARFNLTKRFHAEATYNYYDRLYSNINFTRGAPIELPSFGLADLNLGYRIALEEGRLVRLGINVYNVFDELYISRATSNTAPDDVEANNWNGVNRSNFVMWGLGRTWNASVKYQF